MNTVMPQHLNVTPTNAAFSAVPGWFILRGHWNDEATWDEDSGKWSGGAWVETVREVLGWWIENSRVHPITPFGIEGGELYILSPGGTVVLNGSEDDDDVARIWSTKDSWREDAQRWAPDEEYEEGPEDEEDEDGDDEDDDSEEVGWEHENDYDDEDDDADGEREENDFEDESEEAIPEDRSGGKS